MQWQPFEVITNILGWNLHHVILTFLSYPRMPVGHPVRPNSLYAHISSNGHAMHVRQKLMHLFADEDGF